MKKNKGIKIIVILFIIILLFMQTFVIAAGGPADGPGPGGAEVETKDSLGLGDLESYAKIDETPPTEFVKKVYFNMVAL